MLKHLLLYILTLAFYPLSAQNARLHIRIGHAKMDSIAVMINGKGIRENIFKEELFYIPLDRQGSATYSFPLKKPERVSLFNYQSASDAPFFGCTLYLCPGDDLRITMDPGQKNYGLTVSGKGSENNPTSFITYSFDVDLQPYFKDSLPYRGLAAIRRQQQSNDSAVKELISKYHPSQQRINSLLYELQYYTPGSYYAFMGTSKFYAGESYERNYSLWKAVRDSLFSTIRLSNDSALMSYYYTQLLDNFLLREKERLWKEEGLNSEKFYKEWYGTTFEISKDQFDEDQTNALQEKIIERYFNNRSAQYLYGILFENAYHSSNPQNVIPIFERFSRKYPNGEYISWVKPYIDTVNARGKLGLNDKMILINSSHSIFTFDSVLSIMKGKTALLDMWGTWCGPCREEIEKNSRVLKEHFAGKGLDYLYIANFDEGNGKTWKELIAYFHLEGMHIQANQALTNDIMKKVNGNGYPTYIVIKKDGSYELSKAGYPMDRNALIRQLEEALSQ